MLLPKWLLKVTKKTKQQMTQGLKLLDLNESMEE